MTKPAKKGQSHIPNPAGRTGAPVSLFPLTLQEAIAGLAQVKMPAPDKPKTIPKKGK